MNDRQSPSPDVARAAVLLLGSEMMDGVKRDANGPVVVRALADIGVETVLVARVPDIVEEIAETLRLALKRADFVVTSGGLGPTGDDLTRDAAALVAGRSVVTDEVWLAKLEKRLADAGRKLDERGRRQALVVEGATPIRNPVGLACGCDLEIQGKRLFLLPGVPAEFSAMVRESVVPTIVLTRPPVHAIRVVKALAAGLPEVEAEKTLAPWYERPGITVSILPSAGVQRVRFTISSPPVEDPDALEKEIRASLRSGLGEHLVGFDGLELPEALGGELLERGWTLASAESCTGGLVSRMVISVSGASRYFLGGITAYHNDAKMSLLGVPPSTLKESGAVSEETARAMARGARARFNASCAVATTGIAGPTGDVPGKPIGTLWIAVSTPEGENAQRFVFPVTRSIFTELASNYALFLMLKALREDHG